MNSIDRISPLLFVLLAGFALLPACWGGPLAGERTPDVESRPSASALEARPDVVSSVTGFAVRLQTTVRRCTDVSEPPRTRVTPLPDCTTDHQNGYSDPPSANCKAEVDGIAPTGLARTDDRLVVTGEHGTFREVEGTDFDDEPTTLSSNRRFAVALRTGGPTGGPHRATGTGSPPVTIHDDGSLPVLDIRYRGPLHRLELDRIAPDGASRRGTVVGEGGTATAATTYAEIDLRGVAALPDGRTALHFYSRGGRTPGGSSLEVTGPNHHNDDELGGPSLIDNLELRRIGDMAVVDDTIVVAGSGRRSHPVERCTDRPPSDHSFLSYWCYDPTPAVAALTPDGERLWNHTPKLPETSAPAVPAGRVTEVEPMNNGDIAVVSRTSTGRGMVRRSSDGPAESRYFLEIINDDGHRRARTELPGPVADVAATHSGDQTRIVTLREPADDEAPRIRAYNRDAQPVWSRSDALSDQWRAPSMVGLPSGEVMVVAHRPAPADDGYTPVATVVDATGADCSAFPE